MPARQEQQATQQPIFSWWGELWEALKEWLSPPPVPVPVPVEAPRPRRR